MGDLQCQALARDIARRLHFETASHDELRVIDRVLVVLEQRRDRVGPLDIRDKRNWHTELGEGLLNAVIFCAIETMRAEDETRAELREEARREMSGEDLAIAVELPRVAEWQADLTRSSNVPAQLAGADPRDSYDELAIEETGGESG